MSTDAMSPGRPQRFGRDDWRAWVPDQEDPDGIDAVAALLALRCTHRLEAGRAEAAMVGRALPPPVLVIGLAGPVASGKSTIAAALADRLAKGPAALDTAVVSTDGFLHPNTELDARGLTLRKGFPETYDLDALRDVLARFRRGDGRIAVPVHSHETYDIAPEPQWVERPQVLVLEGVNALQGATDGGAGPADLTDVSVYVHADEPTIITWFVDRFLTLTTEARSDPSSFYRLWSDLSDDEVRAAAREVWDGINAVNLHDHIGPSRSRADLEMIKGADHRIEELRLHPWI